MKIEFNAKYEKPYTLVSEAPGIEGRIMKAYETEDEAIESLERIAKGHATMLQKKGLNDAQWRKKVARFNKIVNIFNALSKKDKKGEKGERLQSLALKIRIKYKLSTPIPFLMFK